MEEVDNRSLRRHLAVVILCIISKLIATPRFLIWPRDPRNSCEYIQLKNHHYHVAVCYGLRMPGWCVNLLNRKSSQCKLTQAGCR